MSIALWDALQPNVPHDDNDLKYRYMKMKDDVSPELMAELEDMFTINCDAERIKQMRGGIIGVWAPPPVKQSSQSKHVSKLKRQNNIMRK